PPVAVAENAPAGQIRTVEERQPPLLVGLRPAAAGTEQRERDRAEDRAAHTPDRVSRAAHPEPSSPFKLPRLYHSSIRHTTPPPGGGCSIGEYHSRRKNHAVIHSDPTRPH